MGDSHGDEGAELASALGEVDVLYVDGDHGQRGVEADCEMWLPRVKSVVAFHDWGRVGGFATPILDRLLGDDWLRVPMAPLVDAMVLRRMS